MALLKKSLNRPVISCSSFLYVICGGKRKKEKKTQTAAKYQHMVLQHLIIINHLLYLFVCINLIFAFSQYGNSKLHCCQFPEHYVQARPRS